MKRNKHYLWLAVSAIALMGFSFAAGYGLRALIVAARGGVAEGSERALRPYPRIASRGGAETIVSHGQVFSDVIGRLKELYVEPLPPPTTLSMGAVDGMLAKLGDTNTRLLDPREWEALSAAETGAFRGLGAVLTIRRQRQADDTLTTHITVVTPMPGSPAEKAGLEPGDRITSIDNHWIAPTHLLKRTLNMLTEDVDFQFNPQILHAKQLPDEERPKPPSPEKIAADKEASEKARDRWRHSIDLESAMDALVGATDGEHTLGVERAGAPKPLALKVQFTRTTIQPVVKKRLAPAVGYLQVRQINAEAIRALDQAIAEFRASGLKSLVLDLRHSAGGPLAQAQELASRFLPGGAVAILEKRDSGTRKLVKKPLNVRPVERRAKFKAISVLVDGATAGTSELLAASLRDAGLAKLVGATTFGDGTEQMVFPLDNGSAVSITTAKMLSRGGTDFDGKGLKPDVAVAPTAGADRALEQALRLVRAS